MTSFPTRTIGPPVTEDELGQGLRYRQERQKLLQRYGRGGYLLPEAIQSEWAGAWAVRQVELVNQPWDDGFTLTEDLVKHYGEGIDPDLWELFADARSLDGMDMIRRQALDVSNARGRLQAAGLTGAITRVGASILDPAFIVGAIGLGAVTGGTGTVAAGATRAARATAILRAGLIGAASDAAVQSYISSRDPTQGAMDVVYAGLGSFVLGSAAGGVSEGVRGWRRLLGERAAARMRAVEFEDALGIAQVAGPGAATPLEIHRAGPLTPETRRRLAELVAADDRGRAYFRQSILPEEQEAVWGRIIDESGLADDDELIAELRKLPAEEAFYRFSAAQEAYLDAGRRAPTPIDIADAAGGASTPPPRELIAGDFDASWAVGRPIAPADQAARNPFTYHAILGRVPEEETRRLASILAYDPVLRDPRAGPQGQTALEFKSRTASRHALRFFKSDDGYDRAFAAFRRTRGVGPLHTQEAAKAFGREVSEAVLRGGTIDPVVEQGRKAAARALSDLGELARRHQLPGFEDFTPDERYFPFLFSPEKVRAAETVHGESEVLRHVRESLSGLENLPDKRGAAVRAFMKSADVTNAELAQALGMTGQDLSRVLATDEGPADELLTRIAALLDTDADSVIERGHSLRLDVVARGYQRIIRNLDRVPQSQAARALMGDDPEGLAELLRISGVEDEGLISNILKNAKAERSAPESPTARGRRSMPIDRAHETQTDAGILKWTDLIEDDAAYVVPRYIDDITGAVAEHETMWAMTRSLDPDATGALRWTQVRDQLERRLLPALAGSPNPRAETGRILDRFDELIDHLRGRPLTADTRWNRLFRRLRMAAGTIYNGSFGLINLGEISQPMAEGGARAVLRHVPAALTYAKLARKGGLPREFFTFADSFSDGFAADIARFRTRFETGGAIEELGGTPIDKGLFNLARVSNVVNGLIPIDRRLRINTMRVAEDRWIESARSGKLPSARRLASLGLDGAAARRITDALNAPGGMVETTDVFGRAVFKADFTAWKDQGAATDFLVALQRWSGRVVQNHSLADLAPWMADSEFFKMVVQFRMFPWAAWDKQLVTKLQFHDVRAGLAALYGVAASTLVYIGRTHLAALGMGSSERREFLDRSLAPGRIAAGAIRYAGWTTFLPDMVDTFMEPGERFFDTRYSGLSSSLTSFDRAPVPALIARAATTPAELFDSIRAGELSRQDARAVASLMPFASHFPVRNLINALGDRLPDEKDRQ